MSIAHVTKLSPLEVLTIVWDSAASGVMIMIHREQSRAEQLTDGLVTLYYVHKTPADHEYRVAFRSTSLRRCSYRRYVDSQWFCEIVSLDLTTRMWPLGQSKEENKQLFIVEGHWWPWNYHLCHNHAIASLCHAPILAD